MTTRLKLVRPGGETYLERWGWECRWFGVFVHRIDAPDPGIDLHDHEFGFVSCVLRGGYKETRAQGRTPNDRTDRRRGWLSWGSVSRAMCHRIFEAAPGTWTLVLHGPRRSGWGFYTPGGWVHHNDYDESRRNLTDERKRLD